MTKRGKRGKREKREATEAPGDQETQARYTALVRAWQQATGGETPGEIGPCSMAWQDGILFAVEANTGLVVGVSTEEWAECLWLPPEVLPLVVKAARRGIKQAKRTNGGCA